jgi:hypothetical protein
MTMPIITQYLVPVLVGHLFVLAVTFLFKTEPSRRQFMALVLAGAGSTYIQGGFTGWEFAFSSVILFCAWRGLNSYRAIGFGWLLHTGWDIIHHINGNPIWAFDPTSSFGCALCDPVIAIWCFMRRPEILPTEKQIRSF